MNKKANDKCMPVIQTPGKWDGNFIIIPNNPFKNMCNFCLAT